MLNFSRAGILILVAGSGLLAGRVCVLRKGSAARIALGVSVLLVLLTVMLVFGGQTFERFNLRAGDTGDWPRIFAGAIFQDALQLISASPWFGIGLGNFDAVFAVFRDASLTERPDDPSRERLVLALGGNGVAGMVLTLVGLALLVRRVFPLQEGTNQRFPRSRP